MNVYEEAKFNLGEGAETKGYRRLCLNSNTLLAALNHFCGVLHTLRLFHYFAVEQVDCSVGMLGKASIVSNHADGSAFTMQLLQ